MAVWFDSRQLHEERKNSCKLYIYRSFLFLENAFYPTLQLSIDNQLTICFLVFQYFAIAPYRFFFLGSGIS